MKIITALLFGASLFLSAAPAVAQNPFDDAMALLETDPPRGLAAMEALANNGDNDALNAVAAIIDNPPDGVPQDRARALRLWEQAVEGGSSAARLNLGSRLILNDDPSDDERAVEMLRAVRSGDLVPLAAYPLGRAYLFGQGVEQNLERGSLLMRMAVEATPDNIDAQFLLGRAYQNGWGIPADAEAAYRHLKFAADGGDSRAQWNVGMALLNGDGVTANPVLAHAYVRASAEDGDVAGMVSLAVMLALGQGVAPDPAQARQWYRRAAETGSAHALRGLGGMLLTGEGGRIDGVTGAAYLELAAKAGDENAPAMQRAYAEQIASLDRGAVEAVKAAWLREYGIPR